MSALVHPACALPGDIGFACQPGFVNWWIKYAQRRKYGRNNPVARWNHTFMVTTAAGDIVQATGRGTVRGHLSDYAGQDIELRRPPYAIDRRTRPHIARAPGLERRFGQVQYVGGAAIAVAVVESMVGERYGFLTIASVALSLLTGTKLRFGLVGTEICSGEDSYAETRANIDVGQDCEFNTPADLFSYAIAQNWIRP